MEEKATSHLMKGLIISLILIVFQLVIYFTGNITNKPLSYVSYIILLAGIIIACIQFSKENKANVTFGNLFAHGFKITALVALIMIIWEVLMFKILFPNLIDQIMQAQTEELLKKGMTEEQVNQGINMAKDHFMLFAIAGTIIVYGLLGLVCSLIGAAIAKKNPTSKNPFEV